MSADHRVRLTLLAGMDDLMNLLVHLQSAFEEADIRVIRSGGGMTFSGFSFQVATDEPVDWFGYHIDRPDLLVYRIQDRVLPEGCPLDGLRRLQARQYERTLSLKDSRFFDRDERGQIDAIKVFLVETVEYLRGLPPEDEREPPKPFIPVLDR